MQGKTLFIEPIGYNRCKRKSLYMDLWNSGKAFRVIQGKLPELDDILSIKSIERYRPFYDRICIQYDMGIVDV